MCLLFLFVVLPYLSLDGDGMLPILLSIPSCMSLSVYLHPSLLHMAVGVSSVHSVALRFLFRLLFLVLFIPSVASRSVWYVSCRLSSLAQCFIKNQCILSRLHDDN